LRALTIARNSAVKATTMATNQIKATPCSQLPPGNGLHAALASLGRRWLQLHEEILELDRLIRDHVRRTVPKLLERPGIGIHSAAQLLITAGGNPDRLDSDAAFAALCGASPVQASSGQRQRHRLNRGGDRAANNALWTIANNRMIHDARTREFAQRRRQLGDSRNDTLRVLKRYIARETFTGGTGLTSRCAAGSLDAAGWSRVDRWSCREVGPGEDGACAARSPASRAEGAPLIQEPNSAGRAAVRLWCVG
jgi:transposase